MAQMQYLITGKTLGGWSTIGPSAQVNQEQRNAATGRLSGSKNSRLKAGEGRAGLLYVTLEALLPKGGHSKNFINYRLQMVHAKEPAGKEKCQQPGWGN